MINNFDRFDLRQLTSGLQNLGHVALITILQYQTDIVLSKKAVVYADDEGARLDHHVIRELLEQLDLVF
jgi:hypothetical protein